MRLALLVVAACLGLTGCATIESWFAPSTPPAGAEQPEERARRAAPPPTAFDPARRGRAAGGARAESRAPADIEPTARGAAASRHAGACAAAGPR